MGYQSHPASGECLWVSPVSALGSGEPASAWKCVLCVHRKVLISKAFCTAVLKEAECAQVLASGCGLHVTWLCPLLTVWPWACHLLSVLVCKMGKKNIFFAELSWELREKWIQSARQSQYWIVLFIQHRVSATVQAGHPVGIKLEVPFYAFQCVGQLFSLETTQEKACGDWRVGKPVLSVRICFLWTSSQVMVMLLV